MAFCVLGSPFGQLHWGGDSCGRILRCSPSAVINLVFVLPRLLERERERELFFTSAAKSCELFWGHFAIIRQHGWRNATQWEKRRGLNPLQDLNQCHCGLWIIMYYGVGVVNIKIYIWKHRTQSRRQDEDKVHFQNKRHVSVDWP